MWCQDGATMVDGICANQNVANFVTCLRARGVEINNENRRGILTEVDYIVKAKMNLEINKSFAKIYSESPQISKNILRVCEKLISAEETKEIANNSQRKNTSDSFAVPVDVCKGSVVGTPGVKINKVRALPNINSPSKIPIKSGSLISILDSDQFEGGRWYRITYASGTIGWIPKKYISVKNECQF